MRGPIGASQPTKTAFGLFNLYGILSKAQVGTRQQQKTAQQG